MKVALAVGIYRRGRQMGKTSWAAKIQAETPMNKVLLLTLVDHEIRKETLCCIKSDVNKSEHHVKQHIYCTTTARNFYN